MSQFHLLLVFIIFLILYTNVANTIAIGVLKEKVISFAKVLVLPLVRELRSIGEDVRVFYYVGASFAARVIVIMDSGFSILLGLRL